MGAISENDPRHPALQSNDHFVLGGLYEMKTALYAEISKLDEGGGPLYYRLSPGDVLICISNIPVDFATKEVSRNHKAYFEFLYSDMLIYFGYGHQFMCKILSKVN